MDFVFQNTTKIYFGENQFSHLAEEVTKYGTKVLLAYGGGSIKKTGLYDKVCAELKRAKLQVFELSGIEPNPRHTTVNRGAEICKREHIDVVLAVGGGSTIDCAKAVCAASCYDGDSWELVLDNSKVKSALPLVTILTLSATGSEMDAGAVISNMDTHEKLSVQSDLLLPKASFLDPTNTYTVPAYQTASGSADIMSHIFDLNYFSFQPHLEMLDDIMEAILKIIVKYAPVAIHDPTNYDARANLMWASSWALNNFLKSGVKQQPSCHKMEHELSAFYDITHGHGLAILTPRWLTYITNKKTAPLIYKFGRNIFGVKEGLSDTEGAKLAVDALSNFFFKDLGLASTLTELGIDDKNFKAMAKGACRDGGIHGFVDLNEKDVENIFKMCL